MKTQTINWAITCTGCGECCGPVPFTKKFLTDNTHLFQRQPLYLDDCFEGVFVPITKSLDCVFLDKAKRCLVYDNRPEVCRLQGTIPQLPCPHLSGANLETLYLKGAKEYGKVQKETSSN